MMYRLLLALALITFGCSDDAGLRVDPANNVAANNGSTSPDTGNVGNADAANNANNSVELPPIRSWVIGQSVSGRPLIVELYGTEGPVLYLLASIHGDERLAMTFGERIRSHILAGMAERAGIRIFFFQVGNPDGVVADSRENARGIDLNRNFPADNFDPNAGGGDEPLSEPESVAIYDSVQWTDPAAVVTVHCCAPTLDWDGPGEDLAIAMSDAMDPAIAFPTVRLGSRAGSFGSLIGVDIERPIVTVEFALGNGDDPAEQLVSMEQAVEAAAFWTAQNGLMPQTTPSEEIVGEAFNTFEPITLGTSASGLPLRAQRVGFDGVDNYVLSGLDGDGFRGEAIAEHLRAEAIRKLRHNAGEGIWFMTGVNPDALAFGGTANGDGTDVVADLAAATTPEARAVTDWLGAVEPGTVWIVEDSTRDQVTAHGPGAAQVMRVIPDAQPAATASAELQPAIDALVELGHTVVLVEVNDVFFEAQGIDSSSPDYRPSQARYSELIFDAISRL